MDRDTTDHELHKPHIVMLPYPAQGHIPPVIFLAKKLAEHGFIVTLVFIDSIHRVISRHWTCPPGQDIRLEQVPCELSMPQGFDSSSLKEIHSVQIAIENTRAPARHLLSQLSPPPFCLLSDYGLSWGVSLAKDMNLHSVTYWPGNASWCSLHHHLDLLVSHGDAFQGETRSEKRVISYLPGFSQLSFEDLPEYMRKEPDEAHSNFFERSKGLLEASEWILVNSMSELEPDVFQDMQSSLRKFVSIGPLFQLSGDKSPSGGSLRDENYECLKWLDTQAESSVLYISFGSIGTLSDREFEELAVGLEASGQPFLWVARLDLVEEKNQDKYIEFVERTREQGMVVPWAPQVQVLSHSSVGGFLSHCGWNSTFESICHGVPVLGYPLFADQLLNSKFIAEDWRFGKRVSKEITREQVEESIREFMHGKDTEDIRARVREFKELAAKTVQEGGHSQTNIQSFVDAMKELAL